jgi:transcription initiation factor TFIIB
MEHSKTTKKNRNTKINKNEMWDVFNKEIHNSNNIECIFNKNEANMCSICNHLIALTEEGYYTCTNNSCSILYTNIFDYNIEYKNAENNDCRYGQPINPLLEESSYGCKINCSNSSSYEMRKIKRYTDWQSMPYKEKAQYDEFQRITNMASNGNISKIIIDDAVRYHKLISEYKTFRGLNRDGIIAASIYISCRINKTPRSAKEIANIFHLDTTSATKGCKNAISIINVIEKDMNTCDKTDLGNTSSESFIERYCSRINMPSDLINLAIFISKIVTKDNLIPENTPPAVAAGIIFFIINEFNLDISKKLLNQISEISEVTINKCYKKIEILKVKLIPKCFINKYKNK